VREDVEEKKDTHRKKERKKEECSRRLQRGVSSFFAQEQKRSQDCYRYARSAQTCLKTYLVDLTLQETHNHHLNKGKGRHSVEQVK
jgi:hypothetical protein